MVVVGTEHLGRHRLAEAAASGDAAETPFREKRVVDHGNEPCLIDVFPFARGAESLIPNVDINTHDASFYFQLQR